MLSLSGAELIDRLQHRDPKALDELYRRYGRIVYSLILRVVRDTGIAEDLVQETFLRAWTRAWSLDPQKGSIGPWLLAVARHNALDYLRSGAARERIGPDLEEIENPAVYQEIEPELLRSENLGRIQAAIGKLSPQQREVLDLAYFEGLSQSEIAERMGQPLGTVKTWARSALKRLRAEVVVS